ncbi:tail fiber assembly protein [Escherichia coli]|uniref:tail fiber assembly protein n=1 Tax=Escherichia coli TaxID=562 RepID=UPI000DF1E300|nr:tail fiber assembly protein [Escherichia coli]HBM9594744.1 tail fiber assembly protein [Escherichia coli]
MNAYFFSASVLGFFALDLKDVYDAAGTWPDDAVSIDNDTWQQFISTQPAEKQLGADAQGNPVWVDIPAPNAEELIAAAEREKQVRIEQANYYINSKQWPGKAVLGRLKGIELEQYNLWLDYLDALEAVDTSSAPDINWPVSPAG